MNDKDILKAITISKTSYDVTLNASGKLVACGKTAASINVTPDQYTALHQGASLVNGAIVPALTGQAAILAKWNSSQKNDVDRLVAASALYSLQGIGVELYVMAKVKLDDDGDSALMNQLRAARKSVDALLV